MKHDYDKIQQAFNKAANSYDENCLVQQQTGKKLIQLSKQFASSNTANIIDLGCGTGMITQQLASEFNFQEFHAIDIATKLLNKAKERLKNENIQIYEANFDELRLSSSFNMIFSNMALHWSINLDHALNALSKLMSNNGILAFSIPLAGTFNELPLGAKNSFFTLSDIEKKITQSGLTLLITQHEKIITPFKDTINTLRLIKKTGVNYVRNRQYHQGLRGKSFLSQMKINQLTFCIGYFIAKVNL